MVRLPSPAGGWGGGGRGGGTGWTSQEQGGMMDITKAAAGEEVGGQGAGQDGGAGADLIGEPFSPEALGLAHVVLQHQAAFSQLGAWGARAGCGGGMLEMTAAQHRRRKAGGRVQLGRRAEEGGGGGADLPPCPRPHRCR